MDRNLIIKMLKNMSIIGTINAEDANTLLLNYCIDNDKEVNKSIEFINILLHTPFVTSCIHTALEYYKKKFTVIELKQGNNTLLIY